MEARPHTKITPDWHRWIGESLAAGHGPADLLTTMREHRFDERAARDAIADAVFGGAAPREASDAVPASFRSRLGEGHVLDAGDRRVRVLARVARPLIAILDGVLDADECAALREMATSRLARSQVVSPGTGQGVVQSIRTSEGANFGRSENELIARVDARAALLMRLGEEHGEGLQAMRYGVGAEYVAHYDYFPPDDPGSRAHLASGGQRVSTLIMYLNDVEAGGETIFPRIDFSYVPRLGQALYFEYTTPEGALDPLSLHGGAPVLRGEKWILTKWMREHAFPG
ncbi:prolyl 4-hydroxylase [Luteibacter sp. UNC138MFCol5.1]|uniref:2OG-Fe(II) oxygenase n=1 Tax=Luteibacter sp. UNC138MFCol5.1 TaxID=1502774 RepID=UPI0008D385BC|nr:2OG-Fe(II) oxygenase [Luteibacter sp. UNC138MFCol5.1]SEO59295.1 prolyl 4-hydroxylase [Luteibacter sp. UNC138MFCol5.1]